jgi:hypothetical protein
MPRYLIKAISLEMTNLYFKEEQRFTQWWLWLILIAVALIPVYGIIKQVIGGEQFGDNPLSDFGLIFLLIFMIGFLALFWIMKLSTEIDDASIKMNFYPFTKKEIKWTEIKSAEVLNYGFVGGWGIRLGTKYGTVYNTSGNIGLAIVLKNNQKLCIGTIKETELKEVINEAKRQGKF